MRLTATFGSEANSSTSRATAGTMGTASSEDRQSSLSIHSGHSRSKIVPDETPARI
jgi:hypothetical protein